MTHILDPKFRYYPSYDTDLRRTFARVRAAVAPRRIVGVVPEMVAPYGAGIKENMIQQAAYEIVTGGKP